MLHPHAVRPTRAAFIVAAVVALEPLAFAQEEAPVPPDPGTGAPAEKEKSPEEQPKKKEKKPSRQVIAPGFDSGTESANEPPEEPADKHEKSKDADETPKKKKKRRGRASGFEDEDEDIRRPVDVSDTGFNERLVRDINATTGEVSLQELLDEILADVVAELDARPAKWFSPMAIRHVILGEKVVPSYAQKLQATIMAEINAGTDVRVVECMECEATRARLVGKEVVITRGVVTTEEMRRVADSIGVKSFMDVSFGFEPASGIVEMSFRVIRAKDSYVLWSDTFRADETTPMLLRSSEAPMKRKDRLRDLEMLLEGRPLYGYVATAGFMILPHNDPVDGDISGATAGYRIYERFGTERRVMFGLDLTGFLNTSRLAGAVISAGSWWIPLRPDLVNPELRLGAKAGAFIAGTAGNAAVFQLGAEVLLRYRFGLYAYVLFMTKSEFPPMSGNELGGVGMATGMSFNW